MNSKCFIDNYNMNDRSFKLSINSVYVRVCVYCTRDICIIPCTPYDRLLILIGTKIKKCNIVSKILLIFEIFNKAFLKVQAIIASVGRKYF